MINTLTAYVNNSIIAPVNLLRSFQDKSGLIVKNFEEAECILQKLVADTKMIFNDLELNKVHVAFGQDVFDWISSGVGSQAPNFFRTQNEYVPPSNGATTFFIGPFKCQNGPAPLGFFFECFLAKREEPEECKKLYELFPHPKNACQSVRLFTGSAGVSTGNCVVFFPENIASKEKIVRQKYALFFFNKFSRIYSKLTIPVVEQLFGHRDSLFDKPVWTSKVLNAKDFYTSRCMWGYLHDYFHHQGVRPFDENIQLKLNWFVGLLEEIKVDCQTILACYQQKIQFHEELIEFIFFERLFRYTLQRDATTNFDSGTGFLLFEWLRLDGALTITPDTRLDIDKSISSIERLVKAVQTIEALPSEADILEKSKNFVLTILNYDPQTEKLVIPQNFENLNLKRPAKKELAFDVMAY